MTTHAIICIKDKDVELGKYYIEMSADGFVEEVEETVDRLVTFLKDTMDTPADIYADKFYALYYYMGTLRDIEHNSRFGVYFHLGQPINDVDDSDVNFIVELEHDGYGVLKSINIYEKDVDTDDIVLYKKKVI